MKNKIRWSFFLFWTGACVALTVAGYRLETNVFQIRMAVPYMPEQAPPPGYEKMDLLRVNQATGQTNRQVFFVDRTILLDQNDIKETKVVTSKASGEPEIAITFTKQGRRHFANVTRQNIGKQLAIIIAGRVYSVPRIRTEIPDGKAVVSGSFSQQEAKDLSRAIDEALKK